MKTLLKTIGIVSTLIGSSFLFQNCSEKESIPEGIIPPTDSVSSKIEISRSKPKFIPHRTVRLPCKAKDFCNPIQSL